MTDLVAQPRQVRQNLHTGDPDVLLVVVWLKNTSAGGGIFGKGCPDETSLI